jgi:hypothetical protein
LKGKSTFDDFRWTTQRRRTILNALFVDKTFWICIWGPQNDDGRHIKGMGGENGRRDLFFPQSQNCGLIIKLCKNRLGKCWQIYDNKNLEVNCRNVRICEWVKMGNELDGFGFDGKIVTKNIGQIDERKDWSLAIE